MEGKLVGPAVPELVGAAVRVAVAVAVAVAVSLTLGLGVAVRVGMGVTLAALKGVTVGDGLRVRVGVGVLEGVTLALKLGAEVELALGAAEGGREGRQINSDDGCSAGLQHRHARRSSGARGPCRSCEDPAACFRIVSAPQARGQVRCRAVGNHRRGQSASEESIAHHLQRASSATSGRARVM